MDDENYQHIVDEQELMNKNIISLGETATKVVGAVSVLAEQTKSKSSKKQLTFTTIALFVLIILTTGLGTVGAYAGYRANESNSEVLAELDPESERAVQRRDELVATIIEANDLSNEKNYCAVEDRLLRVTLSDGQGNPDDVVVDPILRSDKCAKYFE